MWLEVDVKPLAPGHMCVIRRPPHDFSADAHGAASLHASWLSSKNASSPPFQRRLRTPPGRRRGRARHPAKTERPGTVPPSSCWPTPWDSTAATISSSLTEPRQVYSTSSDIAPSLAPAHPLSASPSIPDRGDSAEMRYRRSATPRLASFWSVVRCGRRLPRTSTRVRVAGSVPTEYVHRGLLAAASNPVQRRHTGRLRPVGWAGYGYCASHSRYFWGLRLHLVCTPAGLPITYALTNPKVDELDVAIDLFEAELGLLADRHGQTIIADKGYASAEFERRLAEHGVELVRPARRDVPRRRGTPRLRHLRQTIESVNNTLKSQLSLEHHGGHSVQGVAIRILQRLLALTATIWHNHHTRQPVLRSLTAYDH